MLRANQISFNFKLCGQANETYDFLKQRTRTDIPLKPQHTHTCLKTTFQVKMNKFQERFWAEMQSAYMMERKQLEWLIIWN